jgi:hypothetical protein
MTDCDAARRHLLDIVRGRGAGFENAHRAPPADVLRVHSGFSRVKRRSIKRSASSGSMSSRAVCATTSRRKSRQWSRSPERSVASALPADDEAHRRAQVRGASRDRESARRARPPLLRARRGTPLRARFLPAHQPTPRSGPMNRVRVVERMAAAFVLPMKREKEGPPVDQTRAVSSIGSSLPAAVAAGTLRLAAAAPAVPDVSHCGDLPRRRKATARRSR